MDVTLCIHKYYLIYHPSIFDYENELLGVFKIFTFLVKFTDRLIEYVFEIIT